MYYVKLQMLPHKLQTILQKNTDCATKLQMVLHNITDDAILKY